MTTKEIERNVQTLDGAMSANTLVLVALGVSLACLILMMFGVSRAADGAFAFSLVAVLSAALNHKTLSKSKEELWREYNEALQRKDENG